MICKRAYGPSRSHCFHCGEPTDNPCQRIAPMMGGRTCDRCKTGDRSHLPNVGDPRSPAEQRRYDAYTSE